MAANKAVVVNASGAIVAPVSAATFRNNNGLQIGLNIQAWSTDLDQFVTAASWSGSTLTLANITLNLGTGDILTDGDISVSGVSTLEDVTATTVNRVTITTPATSATITVANLKTITVSNTLTLTGTDGSSVAFGAGGTVAYTGGNLSQFAATTSAQLAGIISDETGSGSLVFATNPTLSSPVLGVATGTSFNGLAITATSGSTLTLSNGVTLSISNSLTFTGTNGTSFAFPSSSGTVYATGSTDVAVADGGTGASTASGARTNLGFGTVMKTSDTARELTTTPSADPDVTFSVAANTNYRFRFIAYITVQSATPNFKWGIVGPSSPTAFGVYHQVWNNNLVVASGGLETSTSYNTGYGATLGDSGITYILTSEGYIRNGANAGSVALWWSQLTSSADDTTVKAGSHVIWEIA